jgi:hypothetical protein
VLIVYSIWDKFEKPFSGLMLTEFAIYISRKVRFQGGTFGTKASREKRFVSRVVEQPIAGRFIENIDKPVERQVYNCAFGP